MLLEVGPFVWGDVAVLHGVALDAAADDEFLVPADNLLGGHGGAAASSLQVDVAEEGGAPDLTQASGSALLTISPARSPLAVVEPGAARASG